jgi:hypothetical protein
MTDNTQEVKATQAEELFQERVNVTMTQSMRREIERMAAREGAPMTWVIRRLLLAGMGSMGGSWRLEGGAR